MYYGYQNRRDYSNYQNANQLDKTMDSEPEIPQISQVPQPADLLNSSQNQQKTSLKSFFITQNMHNTYKIIEPAQLLASDEPYFKGYPNNGIIKPLMQSGVNALMQFAKGIYQNQSQWFEAQDLIDLHQMFIQDSSIQTCPIASLKKKIDIKRLKSNKKKLDLNSKKQRPLSGGSSQNKQRLLLDSSQKQMKEHDDQMFKKGNKYPLKFDKLTKIRSELFSRTLQLPSDANKQNKLLASLLIFEVGQNYENILSQAKATTKSLIQNRSTKFLEKYVQYAHNYREYFNSEAADTKQKQFNGRISQDLIKEMLMKGIEESMMILMPDNCVYGFLLDQTIYCNLYSYLIRRQIPVSSQRDSKDLLRALICLTILHELSHYMIRGLGFILEKDNSFIFSSNKQTSTNVLPTFENKSFFHFNKSVVDIQEAKFVLKYQEKLKKLSSALGKQKVSEKFHNIESKMFWLVVHAEIATLVAEKEFDKFQNELNELMQTTLSPELLASINEKPIAIKDLIQCLLQQCKSPNLQRFKSLISDQGKENVLDQYLSERVQFYYFIRAHCQRGIKLEVQCSTLQDIKAILANISIEKEYIPFKLFDLLQIKIVDQMKFIQMQSTIFSNKLIVTGIADSIDLQKEKIKVIEKLYLLETDLPKLISKCKQFVDHVSMASLKLDRQKKNQSGWIIESRLFPKFHEDDFLYQNDYNILQQLRNEKVRQKCRELRSKFGVKKQTDQSKK